MLVLCVSIIACDSELRTDPDDPGNPLPADSGAIDTSDNLALALGTTSVQLSEGGDRVSVPVSITRLNSSAETVALSAFGQSATDESQLSMQFSDASLDPSETSSSLELSLAIGPRAINAQTRTIVVTAESGATALSASFSISVQPTNRPDVYLLIGQSNMIGFSEDNSKQAGPGGLDEPNSRIRQLNVTGNDDENFQVAADFTTPANLYNTGLPLTIAVDPLHDGFDVSINGKGGQRIGPGLSFAKRALADTTAEIYLVPGAWSDTGFCRRDTNRVPGIGWNATQQSSTALSGTLLHDRAIARADITLEQTGGILRGILWHQGEADSDDPACAASYAENLAELADSLRTNIAEDARGATARGPNADVPFIVGTMSMGNDGVSDQTPFSETKQLVDSAHRAIASSVPLSAVVNNDDLVPVAFPCGEGSCVHFGAAAYREMGSRYYDTLISLLP